MASNNDQDKSSKLAASWEHDETWFETIWHMELILSNLFTYYLICWIKSMGRSKFVYHHVPSCTIHNLPCWDPLGQRPSDSAWRMHLLYLSLAFHLFFGYLHLTFNGHSNHTADQQIRLPLLWIRWNPGDQHSFRLFQIQASNTAGTVTATGPFRGRQIFAPWSSETQNLSNSLQHWYRMSSTSKLQYQHIPDKITHASSNIPPVARKWTRSSGFAALACANRSSPSSKAKPGNSDGDSPRPEWPSPSGSVLWHTLTLCNKSQLQDQATRDDASRVLHGNRKHNRLGTSRK